MSARDKDMPTTADISLSRRGLLQASGGLVIAFSLVGPKGALAAGGPSTVVRVRRLGGLPNSRMLAAVAYCTAAAVLVVPTIALAVPWLTELQRLFTG